MEHMIERSLRAHGHEMQDQLHQHPGASVWERGSLGRMSVPVETVLKVPVTVKGATSLVGIVQI